MFVYFNIFFKSIPSVPITDLKSSRPINFFGNSKNKLSSGLMKFSFAFASNKVF